MRPTKDMHPARWILLLAATSVLTLTACGGGETEPPESEDLSQATDLFENPIRSAPAAERTDPLVVTVDGQEIYGSDIEREIGGLLASRRQPMTRERFEQQKDLLARQAIDNLINRHLLRSATLKNDAIEVTEQELEEAVEAITRRLPPEVGLDEFLAEQELTMESFRENLAQEFRIGKMLEQIATEADVEITPEEVQAFYSAAPERFERPDTVRARHILFTVEEGMEDAVRTDKRTKAEAIRQRALEGADFAELARQFSEGPTAERGGDLGTFARGQMVPAFEEAAFELEPGEISPVVETRFGYHVILVEEREAARQMALEEVADDIRTLLERRERQSRVRAFIDQLRSEADIQFSDPAETAADLMERPDLIAPEAAE
jgi:peptidyl-prolyl cis-trans isomerase C